jgi:hypothetical protein
MQSAQDLSIGRVATRAGLSLANARHYNAIGLGRKIRRSDGAHRRGTGQLHHLCTVAHCRNLGFRIEHIRSLPAVAINATIEEFIKIRRPLKGFVTQRFDACAVKSGSNCTVIDSVSKTMTMLKSSSNE